MNERVKHLAEQSGYEKDMFGVGHWDMPECQKLVELIVQECCDIIQREGYNMVPGFLQRLTPSAEIHLIKTHFGVKNA